MDLKEEAGRRDAQGNITPGEPRSERVASQLLPEVACMANTPGGGALLVGVGDDGELIGAATDAEWLRYRLYELSQRRLTVDVSEVRILRDSAEFRLLAIVVPQALEPIRVNNRISWRVDDHCVEIDAATWFERHRQGWGIDWSQQASAVPTSCARAHALELARGFMAAHQSHGATELETVPDAELLRRLNVATDAGFLTNAGVLLFVGRDVPSVDYMRRDVAGGETLVRLRQSGRSLLEELAAVFEAMDLNIVTRQVLTGMAMQQVREIPLRAAREAVVNGVAHRDWTSTQPTVVEHVGRTLRVTSPGGFFGGVTSENILTHPSSSRNTALTQALADIGIAEREGIGVDRMVHDMIAVGHNPPDIHEIEGPHVRTALIGDLIDTPWIQWLAKLSPVELSRDVSVLLVLKRLVTVGWVDIERLAPIIQLRPDEAQATMVQACRLTLGGDPVLERVNGVPETAEPVWTLSATAKKYLETLDAEAGHQRVWPTRTALARGYARARGRISSTELGSLAHAHPSNMGRTLKALESEGALRPSTEARSGRGFYYISVDDAHV